jgi:hypothetical protein
MILENRLKEVLRMRGNKWLLAAGLLLATNYGGTALAGNIAHLKALGIAPQTGSDPVLQGSGSQVVPAGADIYFFGLTSALPIYGCRYVDVTHVDGNIYDSANSGKLLLHGMDVSVVFYNSGSPDSPSPDLASSVVNGPIYAGGYSATSPQEVDFTVSDFSPKPNSVAILVEGDVQNLDTVPHTVNSLVSGVIFLANCPA